MRPRLEGYAAAVLGTAAAEDAVRRADELAEVDRLFAGNHALRSAITDTSIPPAARQAVLDDLLRARVSPEVRRAVAFAGAAVPAPEVPAAVSWLVHRSHRIAESQEGTWSALGHLAARQRVGGFAAALFEDLAADRLEEMEDELFRFARTVETAPALRGALVDRDLPVSVRRGVVDDLLSGKVQPATLRLVDYVVAAGRPRDVVGTLFWLVDRTAEARGWRVALVAAAREVEADERARLSESLSRIAGWPVELEVTIDPALLAGVRVRIGDLQVDATARGRLDQLREHMAAGSWEDRGYGPGPREPDGAGAGRDGAHRGGAE